MGWKQTFHCRKEEEEEDQEERVQTMTHFFYDNSPFWRENVSRRGQRYQSEWTSCWLAVATVNENGRE